MWGNPWQARGGTVFGPAWHEQMSRPLREQVFNHPTTEQAAYSTHSHMEGAHVASVEVFRSYCEVMERHRPAEFRAWIAPLRSRDLMCWCAEDVPCHADVLLEYANPAAALDERAVTAEGPLKPPFPYYGGKTRIAAEIVEYFPEHTHYIEPFAGALSVLFAKPKSLIETVNDLNGDIVNFFAVLRDRREDLERACTLTPHSRDEHAKARDLDVVDPVERARRTFVLLSQGRNASLRKTGWAHFQSPIAGGSRPRYIQKMVGRFAPLAERLLDVTFEHRDGVQVVREFGQHEGNLLYVDPPYLATTRASSGYAQEFSRHDQHNELIDALLECRAAVVLSGFPSDLYARRLAGWHTAKIAGARNVNQASTPETIWSNRDITRQPTLDMEGIAS